ncbi:hypothetical protein NDU88_007119 [Pleurodeles waltl]|uniref:Uncharacterized protein n=1 Tax=Pleurodeles waltl TaxID=8319 RepID=A0AAV7ME94_PLEWA|nr:hypothetical protein NDU88_007119 [Pleurodeles waltl]
MALIRAQPGVPALRVPAPPRVSAADLTQMRLHIHSGLEEGGEKGGATRPAYAPIYCDASIAFPEISGIGALPPPPSGVGSSEEQRRAAAGGERREAPPPAKGLMGVQQRDRGNSLHERVGTRSLDPPECSTGL